MHHAERFTRLLTVFLSLIFLCLALPAAAAGVQVQLATDVLAPVLAPAAPSPFALMFWQIAFPVLLTALFSGLGWVFVKLVAFLHAGAIDTTKGTASRTFFSIAEKLTLIVSHNVADAEATLKPAMISAAADGKLSPEEGAVLRQAVLTRVTQNLAPDLLAAARAEFGAGLEAVLGGMLEKAVAGIATTPPVPVVAVPAVEPVAAVPPAP